jgi:hypothetical protein
VTELLVRAVGPCLLVVVEVESPTRLVSVSSSPEDLDRLNRWIGEREECALLTAYARLDRDRTGGLARQVTWEKALRERSGGGIVRLFEQMNEEIHDLRRDLDALRADVRALPAAAR